LPIRRDAETFLRDGYRKRTQTLGVDPHNVSIQSQASWRGRMRLRVRGGVLMLQDASQAERLALVVSKSLSFLKVFPS
jgi:hypothetical protein